MTKWLINHWLLYMGLAGLFMPGMGLLGLLCLGLWAFQCLYETQRLKQESLRQRDALFQSFGMKHEEKRPEPEEQPWM